MPGQFLLKDVVLLGAAIFTATAATTLPNFRQDLGSSVYPLSVASPFFRSLPIKVPWIEPTVP